ncbi:unnamed protein product [Moneuplotes crassus]|uniref:Uncharacterized protein n=1 Tax=Euplotes crassus TaxID=5936 RepID=A0AAD1U9Q8_EUPCR|nr:unnamed protein product [Moneuplotes crassus]
MIPIEKDAPIELNSQTPISKEETKDCCTSPKSKSLKKKAARRTRPRADLCLKKTLRDVKKFYVQLFKAQNPEIVKRRYVNCKIEMVFENMQWTLMDLMPSDLITDDLVYYSIGILSIKSLDDLDCSKSVKIEISTYLATIRNFTIKGFNEVMKSTLFRSLCVPVILQGDKESARILQDKLLFNNLSS